MKELNVKQLASVSGGGNCVCTSFLNVAGSKFKAVNSLKCRDVCCDLNMAQYYDFDGKDHGYCNTRMTNHGYVVTSESGKNPALLGSVARSLFS